MLTVTAAARGRRAWFSVAGYGDEYLCLPAQMLTGRQPAACRQRLARPVPASTAIRPVSQRLETSPDAHSPAAASALTSSAPQVQVPASTAPWPRQQAPSLRSSGIVWRPPRPVQSPAFAAAPPDRLGPPPVIRVGNRQASASARSRSPASAATRTRSASTPREAAPERAGSSLGAIQVTRLPRALATSQRTAALRHQDRAAASRGPVTRSAAASQCPGSSWRYGRIARQQPRASSHPLRRRRPRPPAPPTARRVRISRQRSPPIANPPPPPPGQAVSAAPRRSPDRAAAVTRGQPALPPRQSPASAGPATYQRPDRHLVGDRQAAPRRQGPPSAIAVPRRQRLRAPRRSLIAGQPPRPFRSPASPPPSHASAPGPLDSLGSPEDRLSPLQVTRLRRRPDQAAAPRPLTGSSIARPPPRPVRSPASTAARPRPPGARRPPGGDARRARSPGHPSPRDLRHVASTSAARRARIARPAPDPSSHPPPPPPATPASASDRQSGQRSPGHRLSPVESPASAAAVPARDRRAAVPPRDARPLPGASSRRRRCRPPRPAPRLPARSVIARPVASPACQRRARPVAVLHRAWPGQPGPRLPTGSEISRRMPTASAPARPDRQPPPQPEPGQPDLARHSGQRSPRAAPPSPVASLDRDLASQELLRPLIQVGIPAPPPRVRQAPA